MKRLLILLAILAVSISAHGQAVPYLPAPSSSTTGTGPQGQGYNYRGVWTPNTVYAATPNYDTVTYNNGTGVSYYHCLISHISGSTFDPTKWVLMAESGSVAATPTFTIGTVATLAPGSAATATITGTSTNPIINLGLPVAVGQDGVTPSFSIGTITTLPAGSAATASLTGTSPNYTLNLGVPIGAAGTTPSFTVGTVTALTAGSNPTVTLGGTPPNYTINMGIPAGANGANGVTPTFSVGTVTPLGANATPTVSITGSGTSYTLNFGIPQATNGLNATNPNFTAAATTLSSGSNPTATISGTYPNLIITIGIPAAPTPGSTLPNSTALNQVPLYTIVGSNSVTPTTLTSSLVGADAAGAATTAQNNSLQKANNLSDVANASVARTNLGLGTAAIQNNNSFSIGAGYMSETFTVGASSVSANTIIGFDSLAHVVPVTSSASFGGIPVTTVAAGGQVEVVYSGIFGCTFDGVANIGHIAIPSTTTLGYCHDSGAASPSGVPDTTPLVGFIHTVVSTAGAVGQVKLLGRGVFGFQIPNSTVNAVTQRGLNAVLDLGLDNTGATDNSSKLQAQVAGTSVSSHEIFFPCGNYYFSTGVVADPSGLTLIGEAKAGQPGNGCVNFQSDQHIVILSLAQNTSSNNQNGPRIEHINFSDISAGNNQVIAGLRINNNANVNIFDIDFVNIQGQDYSTGTVNVINGNTTITGVGTAWTSVMAQPAIAWIAGVPYEVASINTSAQTLTLFGSYQGPTSNLVPYSLVYDGAGMWLDGSVNGSTQYGTVIGFNSHLTRVSLFAGSGINAGTGTSRIKFISGFVNCTGYVLPDTIGAHFGIYADTHSWNVSENNCAVGVDEHDAHQLRLTGGEYETTNGGAGSTPYPLVTSCPAQINNTIVTPGSSNSSQLSCTTGILISGSTATINYGHVIAENYILRYGTGVQINSASNYIVLSNNTYRANGINYSNTGVNTQILDNGTLQLYNNVTWNTGTTVPTIPCGANTVNNVGSTYINVFGAVGLIRYQCIGTTWVSQDNPRGTTQRGVDALVDVGLKNTGSTSFDNGVVLQNYLTNNASSNGTHEVFFPCGTYYFSTQVLINEPLVSLLGEGVSGQPFAGCVEFVSDQPLSSIIWVDGSSSVNTRGPRLEHINFQDTSALHNQLESGLQITNTQNFSLHDISFTDIEGQDYITGSVSIPSKSNIVTGNGTSWNQSMFPGLFWIAGIPYDIASVQSATQLTLAIPYQSSTAVSNASYAISTGVGLLLDGSSGIDNSGFIQELKSQSTRLPLYFLSGTSSSTYVSNVQVFGTTINCGGNLLNDSVGVWVGQYDSNNTFTGNINACGLGFGIQSASQTKITNSMFNQPTSTSGMTAMSTCNGGAASQACLTNILLTSDISAHAEHTLILGNTIQYAGTGVQVFGLSGYAPLLTQAFSNSYNGNTTNIVDPLYSISGFDNGYIYGTTNATSPYINTSKVSSYSLFQTANEEVITQTSGTVTFNPVYLSSTVTLNQNVTSWSLVAGTAGQMDKQITVCQPVGGTAYTMSSPPSNVRNWSSIGASTTSGANCNTRLLRYLPSLSAWFVLSSTNND